VVYFVKLGEADDPYRSGRVMRSNLKKGHYFYLLNAPPGRYTAVAVKRWSRDEAETTMFGDSARRLTEVTVQIGAVAFMGELILDQSDVREVTDPITAYLVAFVSPHLAKRSTLEFILGLGDLQRGAVHKVHQDAPAESRFLAAARVDLASGGWIPAIDRRIAELTRP